LITVDGLPDITPDTLTYNILLNACAKVLQSHQCFRQFIRSSRRVFGAPSPLAACRTMLGPDIVL